MILTLTNELVMAGSGLGAIRVHFSPAVSLHVRPVEGPEPPGGRSWNDGGPRGFAFARERIATHLASARLFSTHTYPSKPPPPTFPGQTRI